MAAGFKLFGLFHREDVCFKEFFQNEKKSGVVISVIKRFLCPMNYITLHSFIAWTIFLVTWGVINSLTFLTPKFTSWKQPFPGIEHVAHFPTSPLTLRPLHGGQTSQGKCARVAPAFDAVNDIHKSHRGVAWGVRSGDMPKLPDNSSSNRRREKLSLKCDKWSTSNLGFFWWGRMSTNHQGHFRLSTNLKNLLAARGRCPLRTPAFKRGFLITARGCLFASLCNSDA